jgi:Skp family chaperone for outer membrane proteins
MATRFARFGSMFVLVGASLIGGVAGSTFLSAKAVATNAVAKPEAPSVAVVDLIRVMEGLDEANEARERLRALSADFEKEMADLKAQIKKITDDLATFKDTSAPEALRLLAKRAELQATGQARAEGLQRVIDLQEGERMYILLGKMQDAAKRMAEQQGYDLILADDRSAALPDKDRNGNKAIHTGSEVSKFAVDRRILAASDRLDITAQFITFMNNEFKAGKK